MFNDQMGLTRAVLRGEKTMTRRDAKLFNISTMEKWDKDVSEDYQKKCIEKLTQYKVGDVVAIAQNYRDVLSDLGKQGKTNGAVKAFVDGDAAGADNKMFVKADLMPHHIKITNIRMERLQDISEEDCLKEGVYKVDFFFKEKGLYSFRYENEWYEQYHTAQDAFAALIDKVSGRGTWKSNPWVFIYEFDLID